MPAPSTSASVLLSGTREPCRVVSTSNITLSGLQTIGGVLLESGDRVLVAGQTDTTANGIYTASVGGWLRAPDARTSRAINKGVLVPVQGVLSDSEMYVFRTLNPNLGDDGIDIAPLGSLTTESPTTRIWATGNVVLYVRPGGNNFNTGLENTDASAFATVQGAITYAYINYDMRGYELRIRVADGTYVADQYTFLQTPVGAAAYANESLSGGCVIEGNVSTPGNVIIATTFTSYGSGTQWLITGVRVNDSGTGYLFYALSNGYIRVGKVVLSDASVAFAYANFAGTIEFTGSIEVVGNTVYGLLAAVGGQILGYGPSIVFTGSRSVTVFAVANVQSLISWSIPYSGSVTGIRYSVSNNSSITTGGGGASFLPGDSAGSADAGTFGSYG